MYSVLIYDPRLELTELPKTQLRLEIARTQPELIGLLCKKEWDCIITFGEKEWSYLGKKPYHIRCKWVHLDELPSSEKIVETCQSVYYDSSLDDHGKEPLVSIFTPTYNSKEFILQTLASVQVQTWNNWEWVVVDDGSTDGTPELLESIQDPRIRLFKFKNIGRIGYLKGAASSLSRGSYLIELDHDDFLIADAAAKIVAAFSSDEKIGMVYSNCAEWWQGTDHSNMYSAEYWKYRTTKWNGISLNEALYHDAMGKCKLEHGEDWVINNMPICPNHVRAFRSKTLKEVGGYSNLVWADDYDLMIRMFIHSKIHHIDEMLYVQRFGTNTWTKNVNLLWPCFEKIKQRYSSQLRERFKQLDYDAKV